MEHLAEKMKKDIQRGLVLRYVKHQQIYSEKHFTALQMFFGGLQAFHISSKTLAQDTKD